MPSLHSWYPVPSEKITSCDMAEEMRENPDPPAECAVITFADDRGYQDGGECAQAVFFPDWGRGAVAWGANADWSDCSSMEDLIRRWFDGEMDN